MRWESVLAWRMERQHLTRRATDALAVISDICGLHAQVMSSAQLTLNARVEDPPAVEQLLWRHQLLVKTWAMRGTLHLLRTDELPLYTGAQAALKPRTEQPVWLRHHKLSAQQAQQLITRVPEVLNDGPLTREALADAVGLEQLRGGYGDLLKPVAFRGELIFAESEGQNVRFQRPEPFTPMDPQPATHEIARRFLTRYGPGTREDLARWFGHPSPAQAGRWIPPEAVETEFGWALPDDAAAIEAAAPQGHVRLLPAFDQYVVAAPRDTRATPAPERIYRPGGWFSPVLLVDGVMAGIWSRENGTIDIEPFTPLSSAVSEAAEAEADRLSGH